jgi:putative transposase
VSGRQRHRVVDTQGLVLTVVVSAAAGPDRDGARLLAHALRFSGPDLPRLSGPDLPRLSGPDLPRLSLVWADAADGGQLVDDLRQLLGGDVAVVKRSDTQARRAFAVPPHRWMVERTFSWFGGFRRLSKDDEYQVESSEALIYAAMSHLMLRRLARSPAPSSPTG